MHKLTSFMLPICLGLLLLGCVGTSPVATKPTPTAKETPEVNLTLSTMNARQDGQKINDTVLRMKDFLANGIQKIQQGVISEGIIQLVSVLAEGKQITTASSEADKILFEAETELTKIGAALSIEMGTEWLDPNKNQITANTIDIGTKKGLNPSVILALNIGAGKALVSDAPIYFEFTKGSGILTSYVNTNDYGQANCIVTRLDKQNTENIIRASLVYKVKEYVYQFKGLDKDFVFIPPERMATILVLERIKDHIIEAPIILDAVFNTLKAASFDFSQFSGKLIGESFLKVFGGDLIEIKKLGLQEGVSYIVMVLNDGYAVNQVEMGGKKYNIFKSQTTATTRIIRVFDGKILYSGTVQGISGQGGNEQKACLDGLRAAAQAMSDKIAADIDQIVNVSSGGSI